MHKYFVVLLPIASCSVLSKSNSNNDANPNLEGASSQVEEKPIAVPENYLKDSCFSKLVLYYFDIALRSGNLENACSDIECYIKQNKFPFYDLEDNASLIEAQAVWNRSDRIFDKDGKLKAEYKESKLSCDNFRPRPYKVKNGILPVWDKVRKEMRASIINQINSDLQKFKVWLETPGYFADADSQARFLDNVCRDYKENISKTCLYEALEMEWSALAEALCKNGADVNWKNDDGHTALYVAIVNNNLPMVKLLVEKYNANVQQKSKINRKYREYTYLAIAGIKGCQEIFDYLYNHTYKKYNDQDREETFKALLSSLHLSCTQKINNRRTALAYDLIKKEYEYIKKKDGLRDILLKKAIEVSPHIPTQPIIEYLLSGNKPGIKLINLAANEGSKSIVSYFIQLLVDLKVQVDLNERDDQGMNFLDWLILRCDPTLIKLFFEKNPNLYVNDPFSYFYRLVSTCNVSYTKTPPKDILEIADLLQKYVTKVDETNNEQKTPAGMLVSLRLAQVLDAKMSDFKKNSHEKTEALIEWFANHGAHIANTKKEIDLLSTLINEETKKHEEKRVEQLKKLRPVNPTFLTKLFNYF